MEEMNHKPRTMMLGIKLTEKEAEAIREFCKNEGLSFSDYVRKLIYVQLCPKVKKGPPEIE